MKILENASLWLLRKISPHYPAQPDLMAAVQDSFTEWKLCQNHFNLVGPEFADYMIYRLNAAERHYMMMLATAKSEGVKAWPGNLKEPVKKPP
jgi:hypothetical protein